MWSGRQTIEEAQKTVDGRCGDLAVGCWMQSMFSRGSAKQPFDASPLWLPTVGHGQCYFSSFIIADSQSFMSFPPARLSFLLALAVAFLALLMAMIGGSKIPEWTSRRLQQSLRYSSLVRQPWRGYATAPDLAAFPKVGESLHGFTVKRVKQVPELELTALQLQHDKTGAEYLHIARDDANNVFSIGFKTNPPDDTGVPHILEHTTLCGSEK